MRIYLSIIIVVLLGLPVSAKGETVQAGSGTEQLQFRKLGLKEGLSNSQVNCMLQDSRGFVWFGTASGLNRFDGFRFKKFFSQADNEQSLLNDCVNEIYEDGRGWLWLKTMTGVCIYHPETETFDRRPEVWMKAQGMEGAPDRVFVDSHKNLYFVIYGKGVYYLRGEKLEGRGERGEVRSERGEVRGERGAAVFFEMGKGKNQIPQGFITDITETDGTVVLVYNDGTLARVDGENRRVVWVNRYLPEHGAPRDMGYIVYVDRRHNYWVSTNGLSVVYSPMSKTWYGTVKEWLQAGGIGYSGGQIVVKDITEDGKGNLWIATDHSGLLSIDVPHRAMRSYINEKDSDTSLPDNTLQSLMVDDDGALWVGTYKNGVAYCRDDAGRFRLWGVGDVCTIVEDGIGNYWFGTNDKGIVCYHPLTGISKVYRKDETHLGTEIVVSSLRASDGTLWFGTFSGGMAHYHQGQWTVYRTKDGLSNDNVWALAEDRSGNILIGTLGGGLQILNPQTGTFSTYSTHNSSLRSDFIASLFVDDSGDILIGHSVYFEIMDGKTHQITGVSGTRDGKPFSSPAVNQVIKDSRGLIWAATSSGVNVYDPLTDQLAVLNTENGLYGTVACSVVEDQNHDVWVVADNGLSHITVGKERNGWTFDISVFNANDGLQERQFNFRSILLARNGDVLIGGQDGVNIIPRLYYDEHLQEVRAIFSGLILFDHPLSVGESYNGRVVLERALNESKRLDLDDKENAFTIQLAANTVAYPQRMQFQYRLLGLSDQWMRTRADRSEVTFTNLSSGKYRLQVRALDRYGKPYEEVSELLIVVHPPFYLSTWAILFYILLLAAILYYIHRRTIQRQQVKFEIEQMKREAEKERELDDMKMQFFTNASHELRTPLTLIISPLQHMAKEEEDETKRNKLDMIRRNATKLLTLVNQLLDFRKMDVNMESLNLVSGDIVEFVNAVCRTFRLLQDKRIELTFRSSVEHLLMSFDDDKVGKVMNNLLSNAYKFTDAGGKVEVSMDVLPKPEDGSRAEDMLQIRVADTGIGISDEDKPHVFERFYQAKKSSASRKNATVYGSSGVGLSLVKDFVEMHDGEITVGDNPQGGSLFTILLPIRHDTALRQLVSADDVDMPVQATEGKTTVKKKDGRKYEVLIADDSDDFLEFMTTVLGDQYQVRVAHDGKQALQMVYEKHPDVVLTDVMMPVMDGIELCRTLKNNPTTERIPIVMLTARVAQEQKIEGMESGADDYITKPFNLDLLNLRINNLIKWHHGGAADGKLRPQVKQLEITSMDEKLVRNATAYVEKNIADPDLSVEEMSSALGMSRVHLYKRLLSVTGSTPSEFIRQIRLRHAEQLLRQSQLSVSEIAYKVGFNNPRYFSKYFKEMYGIMPSQYKDSPKRQGDSGGS